MKLIPFYIFVFIIATAISQAVFYYPVLPDPLATHFGSGGQANGWMSKDGFFVVEAVLFLIMIFSFIVMPWLFEKNKVSAGINVPNKEYWLAPERIDYFYKYFRVSFLWFGVATLILLAGVMQLTFEANLQPVPVLNNTKFIILFGGYMTFVIIWMISFYRKFGKTE